MAKRQAKHYRYIVCDDCDNDRVGTDILEEAVAIRARHGCGWRIYRLNRWTGKRIELLK